MAIDALRTHELVKIQFGKNAEVAVKDIANDLAQAMKADVVQVIGKTATLYREKLRALANIYRGAEFEDEMVAMYPLCTFGNNPVAASIDTPLHGFLPFAHIDHLHPDWGIALAAAANGRDKMEEFNRTFSHNLIWLPWQRPGFELAMMLRDAVKQTPDCDGIVLGGHGLFTWGHTQRECYLNTLTIIGTPGLAFGGDFGFLQIVMGYMIGRVVVAAIFLPRYFHG